MRSNLKEILVGVIVAVLIILFVQIFPEQFRLQLWVTTMTVILSIYIGFAIKDGIAELLIIQIIAAAFFLALTLLGLWNSVWFLVAAYILHGFWDLLHDYKIIKTKVKSWYPDFCIVVDWILGIWIAYNYLI